MSLRYIIKTADKAWLYQLQQTDDQNLPIRLTDFKIWQRYNTYEVEESQQVGAKLPDLQSLNWLTGN